MSSAAPPLTSDMVQKYLDLNQTLILQIMDSQSTGNVAQCEE